MSRVVLSVCAALLLVACERAPEAGAPMPDAPAVANDTPAGQRIEADVRTLADDRMEGRLTGSAGYDLPAVTSPRASRPSAWNRPATTATGSSACR